MPKRDFTLHKITSPLQVNRVSITNCQLTDPGFPETFPTPSPHRKRSHAVVSDQLEIEAQNWQGLLSGFAIKFASSLCSQGNI